MKGNKNTNLLLIQQYLDGKLDPKSMHELEKEALNDPFLSDALEGYSHAKKPVSHELSILQRQLEERIALKQDEKNYFQFTWQRLSIAAAAGLMFITVGILFWMSNKKAEIASVPRKVNVELSPELSPGYNKPDIAKITVDKKSATPAEIRPEKSKASTSIPYPASRRMAAARTAALKASDNLVEGKVTDTKGVPLPGVSVQLTGGVNVETNVKGEFILPDSLRGTLNIARAGYKTQQLNLNSGKDIDIKLAPIPTALDEVVVSAYGVQQALGSTSQELFSAQPLRGWSNYKEYLDTNVRYPQMETNVVGDVIVGFTIDSHSRPTNVRIIQSLNALCNAEAIRAIRQGPDWEIVDPSKSPLIRVTVNFHP